MQDVAEPLVVIESESGREAFLEFAQRHLPEGEAIVKVRDLVGVRRGFETKISEKTAKLVAREPPLVLRGGLTALVSYYRVRADALEARELHYENGKLSHHYDVVLPVARLGSKAQPLVA